MKEKKVVSFWEADHKRFFAYCVFVLVVIVCLIFFIPKIDISVPAVAQGEITAYRKAKSIVDDMTMRTVSQAQVLAILAVAEQLKRIADALERQ